MKAYLKMSLFWDEYHEYNRISIYKYNIGE